MNVKLAFTTALQFWALTYTFTTVFIVLGRQGTWYGSLTILTFIWIVGWRLAPKLGADIATEAFAYGIWWVLTFAILDYISARPFDATLYDQLPYFMGLILVLFIPVWWFRQLGRTQIPSRSRIEM